MENLRISCGELEVIFSGTVIGLKNEAILFAFPEKLSSFKFFCHFIDDTSVKESFYKTTLLDETSMQIVFVNAHKDLGTGNVEIMELGFIGTRKLFFNYRVFAILGLSNTVHYSFYLGKEGSHEGK